MREVGLAVEDLDGVSFYLCIYKVYNSQARWQHEFGPFFYLFPYGVSFSFSFRVSCHGTICLDNIMRRYRLGVIDLDGVSFCLRIYKLETAELCRKMNCGGV